MSLGTPSTTAAQEHGNHRTVTVTAGQHYQADGIIRTVAGSNWRDVWATPIQVRVLDIGRHGDGLTPKRMGGTQSRTLHFDGADGRRYIFRSLDKFLHREALPEALRNTALGDVVQSQISTLLPAAALVVSPLYEAVGLLHAPAILVVMPDDPRLGEFRSEFAGMVGMIEENPQEGPDDTPGFAGSRKLVGVEAFLDRLDNSHLHQIDAAEYLTARLIQFIVGDADRGGDQWRFAEFPHPSGTGSLWRPVARDHDYAFMWTGGALGLGMGKVSPKFAGYGERFQSLRALTHMTHDMDRRLLASLPRERWDSVVTTLKGRFSDDVLRTAVSRLPAEWHSLVTPRVLEPLQRRRDALHTIADQFYTMVSRHPDIHATAQADRAEVQRLADGSVDVRLYAARPPMVAIGAQPAPPADGVNNRAQTNGFETPYFQRRFLPNETEEIRLYMHGGDDVVQVTGSAPRSVRLRVIGGDGTDRVENIASVGNGDGEIRFYDDEGDVPMFAGVRMISSRFPDFAPGRPLDLRRLITDAAASDSAIGDAVEEIKQAARGLDEDVLERLAGAATHDWGFSTGILPYADFRSRIGMLVGVTSIRREFAFRHRPHKLRTAARLLYAFQPAGFGLELSADYRAENSPIGMSLDMSAVQYDAFRFFGYGNDTEEPLNDISPRIYRDQIQVKPAVYWSRDDFFFSVGPVLEYGNPRYDVGSPIWLEQPLGSQEFTQAGAAADFSFSHGSRRTANPSAVRIEVGGAAYPSIFDATGSFGTAYAMGRAWIPVGKPFFALRAGAERAFGEFPVHESVFLGGRNSLRGFESNRFAGDASLLGSAEFHVPVATVSMLVRGTFGVFALGDAGRVYFDGESPGGWHTAWGGGAWFTVLGRMLSLTYANGDSNKFYLRLGPPF